MNALSLDSTLALFIPVSYSSLGQIVRRQFDGHLVALEYSDEMHPHFSRDVSQHFMAVVQTHLEHGVWKRVDYDSVNRYVALFCHRPV